MEKKEIKINQAKQPEEKKKLSYEELENVCHQLSEQSRALYQRLQDADMSNVFKRLDYLFAIVENSEKFNSAGQGDFVEKCITEIVNIITLPDPEKKEESENSKSEE